MNIIYHTEHALLQIHLLGAVKTNFHRLRLNVFCWYAGIAIMIILTTAMSHILMRYFNVQYHYLFIASYVLVTIPFTHSILIQMFMVVGIKLRFKQLNQHFRYIANWK